MGKLRVVIDPKAIRELENSDAVHEGIRPNAERILDRAIETAPVETGAYRDGLHLEEVTENGVRSWRIAGGSDHDVYVEAEHGTLARALDAGA